ncbi:MAG TPA: adenylate/guanylate cyclase domain-containing protein [Actinomycetota bacterium]|nr:adenylate/guanylate cyclase domain-containing protein [Actinomycetota bacterium]
MASSSMGAAAPGGNVLSGAFRGRIAWHVILANVAAAIVVYSFLAFVSPPSSTTEESIVLELVTFGTYLVVAALAGYRIGLRTFEPVARWLEEDRAPSADELDATLAQPTRQAAWVLLGWCGGGVLFAALHMIPGNPVHYSPEYGLWIGAVAILGGAAAAMLSYLLVERSLRPVFATALARTAPVRPRTLGVRPRIVASWALGSGVVLVAIALVPFGAPRVERAVWFLAPIGLVAGGVIVSAAARSIAEPVAKMRTAVAEIEAGRFDARVDVDDGSEVGLLQAGFNRMAAGLAERERLREVFGTYVDPEIADHILRQGTSLAGEEVEVTIMFLDVRDFTGFAERAPAQEVVATINRLFERAVPIVHEHKGHVDKFVGDGMLAVFGAPRRRPDHADQALAAAIAIARAVRTDLGDELDVGIGLSSGTVVAGNVGGAGRYEFSVIGDAVNVAARVEAATRATGDTILISERTKALLKSAPPLTERPGVVLKGKRDPVNVYALGDDAAG